MGTRTDSDTTRDGQDAAPQHPTPELAAAGPADERRASQAMRLLSHLTLVLVRPKHPANVGAAARACANMGCLRMALVAPRYDDPAQALAMATSHAAALVQDAAVHPDLGSALADQHAAIGATARMGGWRRRAIMDPQDAARSIVRQLAQGRRVALVMGPEDKGLENEEIAQCTGLTTIPTAAQEMGGLASLNLSQASLLLLYECFRECMRAGDAPESSDAPSVASGSAGGSGRQRYVTMGEQEALFNAMRDTLRAIHFLKDQNTDYWLLPLKRLLARMQLRRGEFDLLMGLCRQIRWLAGKAGLEG